MNLHSSIEKYRAWFVQAKTNVLRLAPSGQIPKPFTRRKRRWYRPNRNWLLVSLLVMFCIIYGFAFALFAPFLVVPFGIPILIILLLVIWALPDTKAPTSSMNFLFFAFFVSMIVWPNYLSIQLLGLPWISIIRLSSFPLSLIFLISISVSHEFREKLAAALRTAPLIWKLLIGFACVQICSIPFSPYIANSISRFIVMQTQWTAVFFTGAFLFLKPGRAARWASYLWIMAVFVGVIGVWESRLGRIPWSGHIPAIFQIEDPAVLRILAGTARAALGLHRVQSTFSTSLGLAEYIALSMPFIVNYLSDEYRWITRIAAAATIPFLIYVVLLTDSRLGVIGCLLTLLAFTFVWSFRRWRKDHKNPIWAAVVFGYPVIFMLALASTFVIGHLRAKVWGGGAQQFSTLSRVAQYHKGIPMLWSHPVGYGVDMAGTTLQYIDANGLQTIDTYYLAIALNYGIIGFALYYGMISVALWYGGRWSLSENPGKGEAALALPITVSIMNFLVIKSVFAQQDNHPLIFMMMGMLVALMQRFRNTEIAPFDYSDRVPKNPEYIS